MQDAALHSTLLMQIIVCAYVVQQHVHNLRVGEQLERCSLNVSQSLSPHMPATSLDSHHYLWKFVVAADDTT